MRDRVLQVSGKANPTARDFIKAVGRKLTCHPWVESAKDLSNQMAQWVTDCADDGYVVGATHLPGAFEELVRLVVPILQQRRIVRKEYSGATLRGNMGLGRPAIGAWRAHVTA